jgi:ribulose-bisphosphate carboxylase large chain
MMNRAKLLHDYGWEFAMIDVVTVGTAAVETMRDICANYGLAIHAHRAMHAAFDRTEKQGITMYFLGKIMRMIGTDTIHVGTAYGKLAGTKQQVYNIANMIRSQHIKQGNPFLKQEWYNIKPMLPVSSGGIHPGLIPKIMKILGNECALLVSGGIHGHPQGTRKGAVAAMQAIDASMEGIDIFEYAKKHKELALALKKWGTETPL